MPASHRLAALAIAASASLPTSSWAVDDDLRASSLGRTELNLCGTETSLAAMDACKQKTFDTLTVGIEQALQAALRKTPANIRPLLKRDQVWFNEMVRSAADAVSNFTDDETGETRAALLEALQRRIPVLDSIADGFGRSGFAGKWSNVFGSVAVTPVDGGAYRLAFDSNVVYGLGGRFLRTCKIDALVKPGADGWLTGEAIAGPGPAETGSADKADAKPQSAKPAGVRIRRQGETLRVVTGGEEWNGDEHPGCEYPLQLTGTYFAGGKADGGRGKASTAFVTPTFDCSRPASASEEEICADPDLAENDRKLNRAWKTLLPRLDGATRRALIEDQRGWVKSQTRQYPQFLHPAWEKQTAQIHDTSYARDRLVRLQLERIALIGGFDDKRRGLTGTWLAYNAVLQVSADKDGAIIAKGWKWDQGDWKAGCDYEMRGKLVGGVFRSDEARKNPDTLERDHATLIVNRMDDVFAPKRHGEPGDDAEKCRRRLDASSTARLFPARPSPDIDNLGGSVIR